MAARWRTIGSLLACLVVAWLALGDLPRIPVLAVADLGFASVGRGAGEVLDAVLATPVVPAGAGLVAPVAVPLALAGRFLRSRSERLAGALCLAWAATVLTGLAAAVHEAAEPGPPGPGAASDWAVVLGDALGRSVELTGLLRAGAGVLLLAAIAVCAAPLIGEAVGTGAPPETPATTWSGPSRRRV